MFGTFFRLTPDDPSRGIYIAKLIVASKECRYVHVSSKSLVIIARRKPAA
jgi:hypothetical protein